MAKKQIKLYKFTPGAANSGTIVVPGKVDLFSILLITNVTRGVILFNFADAANTGATVSYKPGGVPTSTTDTTVVGYNTDPSSNGYLNNQLAQLQNAINGQGETTITIKNVDTSSHSATDQISIYYEEKFTYVKAWNDFGTDAIERQRIAAPQSQIDADFEYGLQLTKWQGTELVTFWPSTYEVPGLDVTVSNISTDGTSPQSVISVNTYPVIHGLTSQAPFTIQSLDINAPGYTRAQGTFVLNSNTSPYSFNYYAKGVVTPQSQNSANGVIISPRTIMRYGGFYSNAVLPATQFSSDGTTQSNITVHFSSPHGFTPGMPVLVQASPTYNSNQFAGLSGGYFCNNFPTPYQITFQARGTVNTGGVNVAPSISTNQFAVYARNDGYMLHRPGDGGIIIGTGSPVHGAAGIRQTKKYFRYQSGKGLFYTTGALFAPNYDITNVYAINGSVASGTGNIVVTTSIPHGCQIGAVIRMEGINTSGYNGQYTVQTVLGDNQLAVTAIQTLGATIGDVGKVPKLFMFQWTGAKVQTGPHDDANGMFLEYDGYYFNCVRRTSTLQLAGTATFTPGSSNITGIGTLWTSQLKIGDKIIIKGMVHRVNYVFNNTQISVTPSYRGVTVTGGNYIWLVVDTRVNQQNFNYDVVDGGLLFSNGLNPSGYRLDPNKVQMIGIQFTWYGAGFMDFMVRGPDGNFIIMHRMKQNNVNNTASMRTANLPVRYQIVNESSQGVSRIVNVNMATTDTQMQIDDATYWPNSGYVFCDYELMYYSTINKNASPYPTISGISRLSSIPLFVGGTNQSFSGRPDKVVHSVGAGVELISCTASPTMSHWGSSYIMDGGFDFDRGYQFTYTANTVVVTANTTSVFGLRLGPAASQGTCGDVGLKDLLNRAQFLMQKIDVITPVAAGTTPGTANTTVLVTGIINPSNYFNGENWQNIDTVALGSQPSFIQVAATPTFTGGYTASGEQIPVTGTGQKALPGEKIFEFVTTTGTNGTLDLKGVKELTQSVIGGRGAFPNGPDVIYVNLTLLPATSTATLGNVSVVLGWNEAQA